MKQTIEQLKKELVEAEKNWDRTEIIRDREMTEKSQIEHEHYGEIVNTLKKQIQDLEDGYRIDLTERQDYLMSELTELYEDLKEIKTVDPQDTDSILYLEDLISRNEHQLNNFRRGL